MNLSDFKGRSTRSIVDLDVIASNVRQFRARITPSAALMTVVKANGYGHGAVMIARTALEAGADRLAVATVDEGIQLRRHGIRASILVLGPIDPGEAALALKEGLTLAVASEELIDAVASTADPGQAAAVHLKVDTGMRRYGAKPHDALGLAKRIAAQSTLRLEGVFSHFACADETEIGPTNEQFALFNATIAGLCRAGIDPGITHIANSGATLRSREFDLDMVRVGVALYGLSPSPEIPVWPELKSAMRIESRLGRVFSLNPGDRVSYGGTFVADRPMTAGLVPIGYADGYHRRLSNQGWMAINGKPARVLGRVCMDQTIVEIPGDMYVRQGQPIEVVGGAGPSLDDLATISGTINYEMATSVAHRVPRLYHRSGRVIAIEGVHGIQIIET
jgi:alanine racemase